MTILSLDQSSRISGWSIFIDNKLYTFGKFTCESQDIGARLVEIKEKVISLINKYKPEYVIFEDIQQQDNVSNNVQTFKTLAEVYGVISEILTELNISHSSVLAATWKSSLGIKGKTRPEQKKSARDYVLQKYNVQPTEDECDSICIGEYYIKNQQCAWSN